jgi:hypothetical protein
MLKIWTAKVVKSTQFSKKKWKFFQQAFRLADMGRNLLMNGVEIFKEGLCF